MELYINQEAFTGNFSVTDEFCNERWHAKRGGTRFSRMTGQWDELHVFDADGTRPRIWTANIEMRFPSKSTDRTENRRSRGNAPG